MDRTDSAIRVRGLERRFGAVEALRSVDLTVPAGTVCALLGPNGAGKTTIVRILATLVRPDAGQATVAGLDVVRDAARARYRIGLVGQHPAVDEKLTGRENLRLFCRLYRLRAGAARRRADELLEQFGLVDAADRAVGTYSGGMRRRLDLAAGLILAPAVLFLDEPTTGLDPASRGEVWNAVRALVRSGTTVLLTTQYLDEADQLADRIAVLDRGRLVAEGTPAELKARIGQDRLDVVVADPAALPRARSALADAGLGDRVRASAGAEAMDSAPALLVTAVQALDRADVPIRDVAVRRPTLDDVFLQLTGDPADAALDPLENSR